MEPAVFSIQDYQFDKVLIDLSKHLNRELSLKFDSSGEFLKKDSTFELTFTVSVFNDDQRENPFAMIRCKGIFRFENVESIEDIPDFFYKNSIAILFPYVRAYLSLITTQANVPGIILPTLNLSSLEGELRKNTIQK